MFETLFQKYPFFRKIPAIICMAIIFKISSMTSDDLEGFPHVWDKLAHCCEYATLAGCFCLWWSRRAWSNKAWLKIFIVLVLTVVYGCTDEYHQSFVEGRSSDPMDLIADAIGAVTGGLVYWVICAILNRFDPLPAEEPERDEEDDVPDSVNGESEFTEKSN